MSSRDVCRAIKEIYPKLLDHEHVHTRPFSPDSDLPPGFCNRVHFWTHAQNESNIFMSLKNDHEVLMIKGTVEYMLKENISPKRITVLATYQGQVSALRKVIRPLSTDIDVQTVDRYAVLCLAWCPSLNYCVCHLKSVFYTSWLRICGCSSNYRVFG